MTSASKIAVVINDQHIPFIDPVANNLAFQLIKEIKPDIIDILGDTIDFWQISKFDRNPERKHNIQEDIDKTHEYLKELRDIAPQAEIDFHYGNHVDRLRKYIWHNAKELACIRSLDLDFLLGLKDLHISSVKEATGYRQRGNICLTHGTLVSQDSGMTARRMLMKYGLSVIHGHCFSMDTEILSMKDNRPTWLSYDNLMEGMTVLTYNKDKKYLEWDNINELYEKQADTFVRFKNSAIDIKVTPEHRIFYKKAKNSAFKIDTAENVLLHNNSKVIIPQAAYFKNNTIINGDLLRLLAWIITEGTIQKDGRISIYQSKINYREITNIKQCLKKLKIRYKESVHINKGTSAVIRGKIITQKSDVVRLNISKNNTEHLLKLLPNKNNLPKIIFNATQHQKIRFIKTLLKGDGSSNGKQRYIFYTSSKTLADDVQILAISSGCKSKITEDNRGMKYGYKKSYKVSIVFHTKGSWHTYDNHIHHTPDRIFEEKSILQKVWCLSTNNGIVVMRRKGMVFIIPQTHRMGTIFKTDLLGTRGAWENGCLCKMSLIKEWGGQIANWQQGVSVITYIKNRFLVQPIPIIKGKMLFGTQEFICKK